MKFLGDMGISPVTARFLRSLGHDVMHLHDLGLDEMPDNAILEKARNDDRVLLTHDLDFGQLLAVSGADLPSVVTFRLRNMTPANVNRHMAEILRLHADALGDGAVVTVSERNIRVRRLPIRG